MDPILPSSVTLNSDIEFDLDDFSLIAAKLYNGAEREDLKREFYLFLDPAVYKFVDVVPLLGTQVTSMIITIEDQEVYNSADEDEFDYTIKDIELSPRPSKQHKPTLSLRLLKTSEYAKINM